MIQETIALKDDVSRPAKSAAAAMARLDAVTRRAQKSLGSNPKVALRAMKAEHRAIDKLKRIRAQAAKAADSEAKARMLTAHKVSGAEMVSGEAMLGLLVGIGAGATLAAAKVLEMGAAFLKAVSSAHEARSAAKGMLDVLTGGRGEKTLSALDKMTLSLGVSLEDGRAQFAKFSEATGSIKTSAGLVKLRADLMASGQSAEMADKQIQKVLDAPAGKTAQAMRDVAKEAGVAGNGALAAKKATESWGGAMNRLKGAGARIFDQLAKTAAPSLDKIGKSINTMLTNFQKSKEGQAAIQGITQGMLMFLGAVEKVVPLVMPFITGLAAGLKPVVAALAPIGKAIMKAFGGDSADSMKTAERVGKALGVALTILGAMAVAALTPIVAPMIAVGVVAGAVGSAFGKLVVAGAQLASGLPSLISQTVNRAKAYLDLFIDTATQSARGLIDGLVNGITGGAGRVIQAVKDLGGKVKSALASVLKIGSPSRVMEQFGAWTAEGFAGGIEQSAPKAARASAEMGASATGGAVAGVSAGGGSGGSGQSITINVAVDGAAASGAGGAQALGAEIASAVRREIEVLSRRHAWEGGR